MTVQKEYDMGEPGVVEPRTEAGADWDWLATALIEVTEDPNTYQPTEHADYWRWVAESVAARDDWPMVADPVTVSLDTLDRWQERIQTMDLDIVRLGDRPYTKREAVALLDDLASRLNRLSGDLWTAGHQFVKGKGWEPPTRYMRDNAAAIANLRSDGETR